MIPTLALDLVILVFMDDYASRSNLRQFKYSTVQYLVVALEN